jgi:hypothetical protein
VQFFEYLANAQFEFRRAIGRVTSPFASYSMVDIQWIDMRTNGSMLDQDVRMERAATPALVNRDVSAQISKRISTNDNPLKAYGARYEQGQCLSITVLVPAVNADTKS